MKPSAPANSLEADEGTPKLYCGHSWRGRSSEGPWGWDDVQTGHRLGALQVTADDAETKLVIAVEGQGYPSGSI